MRYQEIVNSDEWKDLKSEVGMIQQEIHNALQNVEYFVSNRNIKILKLFQDFEDKMLAKDDFEGQELYQQEIMKNYKRVIGE